MNPRELLALLNRIYAYMPSSNPLYNEIGNMIGDIKMRREPLPPVEIVENKE